MYRIARSSVSELDFSGKNIISVRSLLYNAQKYQQNKKEAAISPPPFSLYIINY
jgi:hypothetical protein